jgi:hypothetical protein
VRRAASVAPGGRRAALAGADSHKAAGAGRRTAIVVATRVGGHWAIVGGVAAAAITVVDAGGGGGIAVVDWRLAVVVGTDEHKTANTGVGVVGGAIGGVVVDTYTYFASIRRTL